MPRIVLVIVMFLLTACGMAWSQSAAPQPEASQPAQLPDPGAQCYEDGIGCPNKEHIPTRFARNLGCEQLWLVRNAIYYFHGYCFTTDRGRATFPSGTSTRCWTSSIESIQLSPIERANIATLKAEEQRQHCQ